MEDNNYGYNPYDLNIISELKELYSSIGKDKLTWENFLISIYQSSSYNSLIFYLKEKMKNEPTNILTLDIIDFLIDYGPIHLIREISGIEFMNNFLNLLKKSSGSTLEVQKKGIYLVKKWREKVDEDPKENYEGFIHNYMELNNKGICFPPSGYRLITYELYISEYEANIAKSKAEQNINKEYKNNNLYENNQNNQQNFNDNYINNNKENNFINNNDNNIFNEEKNNPFSQEMQFNSNDDIPYNDLQNLDNYFNKIQNNEKKEVLIIVKIMVFQK